MDQLFLELCGWVSGLAPGLGTAGVLGTQGWHAQPLPLCPQAGARPTPGRRGVEGWMDGSQEGQTGRRGQAGSGAQG